MFNAMVAYSAMLLAEINDGDDSVDLGFVITVLVVIVLILLVVYLLQRVRRG